MTTKTWVALAAILTIALGLAIYDWVSIPSAKQAEVQTPPSATQSKQPGLLERLTKQDDATSPFMWGNKSRSAPDPLLRGGSQTTAACAGKKHTVPLGPEWFDTDKHNACRVMAHIPTGVVIEAMDEYGSVYRLLPGDDTRAIVRVRSNQAISFSFSRCPKGSTGVLNWDCTTVQHASR